MSSPESESFPHVDNKNMTYPQSMPSSGSSDPSSGDDANISFVRPPLDPTPQNMKKFRRELTRQILSKPTTEAMLEEALTIYDVEKGCSVLLPDALAALERVFGLEGVCTVAFSWRTHVYDEFQSQNIYQEGNILTWVRCLQLCLIVLLITNSSYCQTATDNHRLRLEIMPAPGEPPPPLPLWLRIPYIVPVEGVEFMIIDEGCINPGIQPGFPLHLKSDGSII